MEMTGILVPIFLFLVTGLVLVTWIYFRSKEKQMMIEKGMSYEQMIEFLKSKRDGTLMLKLGIVVVGFGLGLGIGMLIDRYTDVEEWIPFLIFVCTGLSMVAAYYLGKKAEEKNKS